VDITRGLVQNHTWAIKGIKRESFHMRGNDFNVHEMSDEYSKLRNIRNTVEAYQKHADKTKAICYNVDIHHSKLVCDAFIDAGYPSRHLDSAGSGVSKDLQGKWRKDCVAWVKGTDGAILHNVDIMTAGFDCPPLQTGIINLSTASLIKWLQMTGRPARPFPGKHLFTILDMGGNAVIHGDWNDARNWHDIFHNPDKPRDKKQPAPSKMCPECDSIVPASAGTCKFCGYQFPIKAIQYDALPVELELITKNLDVKKLVQSRSEAYQMALSAGEATELDANRYAYRPLFEICNNIVTQAKYRLGKRVMTEEMAQQLLSLYQEKAKEWCQLNGKRWNGFHQSLVKQKLWEGLEKIYGKWNIVTPGGFVMPYPAASSADASPFNISL